MFDILFINGVCYSMEKEGHIVDAIGVKNGKIAFTGTNLEAQNFESKKIIDLEGKTVIPGLGDSHLHLYAYCQNQTFVDLKDAETIDEMISKMKVKAKSTPQGSWIKGVNFDQSKLKENRFPTKIDLDRISKEHPIIIKRVCLHAVVGNSKALDKAQINKKNIKIEGGAVELGEDEYPTGILWEQATKVFDSIIPDPLSDENVKRKIVSETLQDMSSKGITTIHTYSAKIWHYNEDINLYKELEKNKELSMRVTICLDELFEKENLSSDDLNNPHRFVQMGAYKIFTDGSMGSRSAYLKAPYADDKNNFGFTVCSQEELNDKILTAYKKGLQSAIHAIGDAALDMVLTAIENCLDKVEINKDIPFRLIHVQLVNNDLIERMKKLPIILDVQPSFLMTDLYWLEDRVGKERVKDTYKFKTLLENGLIQTGGSDSPVESYNPMLGIYAAVCRADINSYPEGGFLAEEKLSVYEALSLYTRNTHFATNQQNVLGTLSVNKFADIIILDKNIFEINPEDIHKIKVLKTYLAGEEVYSSK